MQAEPRARGRHVDFIRNTRKQEDFLSGQDLITEGKRHR